MRLVEVIDDRPCNCGCPRDRHYMERNSEKDEIFFACLILHCRCESYQELPRPGERNAKTPEKR